MKKAWNKKAIITVVISILCIVIIGILVYGGAAFYRVNETIEEVTKNPEEVRVEMAVLVLADSEVEEITELSQLLISYMESEKEYADAVIKEISASVGEGISFHSFSNAFDMVDALYAKTVKAVILNKAYLDVLADTEGYEDVLEKIKVIYSYEVVDYIQLVEKEESNLDTFVVYISGIDVWGHVSVVSRSDVNILMVVNTKTKQIQLINTPRDYFVALPNSNGVKDKLTHAALYGVDNSMGALEMLYGVDIDYFVRMNFSGFEAIIDSLGGIDVYSEQAFTVEPIKHYEKGMNHLTGLEALAFARERYAFKDGDHQRGRNQMAVITATVDKLLSPELLYQYGNVLDAVEGTFQTNMTPEEIYELVRMELTNMGAWNIETFAVSGSNGRSTTFTAPNSNAYVMIPSEADIVAAKEKIQAVLEAE